MSHYDTCKQPPSILRLRQNVKQDRLATLYKHMNKTGDPDLINRDRFNYTKNDKKSYFKVLKW